MPTPTSVPERPDVRDPRSPRDTQGADQHLSLSHGERWFLDGFDEVPIPGGMLWQLCDMSQAQAAIQLLREKGVPATYSHLIVRAAALALQKYPEGHQLVCGYTRVLPTRVDIGLSVAGQTSYAPVLVIEGADRRPLDELVEYLVTAVPATRDKELRDLAGMRRTGWIIPIGAIRRWILRLLRRSFWFRRRLVGTFQVTCVPGCDILGPMVLYSGSILGVGRVAERVVAVAGRPEVRLTAWVCIAFDHRTMDGRISSTLLQTIRQVLEGPELLAEAAAARPRASAESPSAAHGLPGSADSSRSDESPDPDAAAGLPGEAADPALPWPPAAVAPSAQTIVDSPR